MGFLSSTGFLVLLLTQGAKSTAPAMVLAEARKIAGSLTARTERSVAFLALAKAQNRMGDRKGATESLRLGWTAHEKGLDKGLSEGDASDWHTLFDKGDLSTLPVEYAYEFVVAGDESAARQAAMSLGTSDLADSYRQGLGTKLRKEFPKAVETVTFTTAQRERRAARKKRILDGLDELRAEPDFAKRSFRLYEAAGELTRLNGDAEAIGLLGEAANASQNISEPQWRAINDAQVANSFWDLGAKDEARTLLTRAEKSLPLSTDEDGRQKARFAIEQTKRSMGLPNDLDALSRAAQPTAAPSDPGAPPPGIRPPASSNAPYALLAEAERYRTKGDLAAAKKTLRRIKAGSGDDGVWLVFAGEAQTKLGDRSAARTNLADASRRFIARIEPPPFFDRAGLDRLEKIAHAQIANGDRQAALQTLSQGIRRLAGTARWAELSHMGDGGGRKVRHDRQSPFLHAGAVTLARAGFYSNAVTMARTIPSPAHRAIALATVVRDGYPPGSYRRST